MLRYFKSGLYGSLSTLRGRLSRPNLRKALSLVAVTGVLSAVPTFAQERLQPEIKGAAKSPAPSAKDQADSPQSRTNRQSRPGDQLRSPAARTSEQTQSTVIPACFEKLSLTEQQRQQIQGIADNYAGSLTTVWKQFGNRYMQAIAMESQLLAAIEDNLTEPQRQQVRDARRKTAQLEKSMAATSTQVNQAAVAPDEATANRENAAETGLEVIEVSLTPEQEAVADEIQQKYHAQLRSLNRDIQGLHTRLVSLEADKLVAMEKVLTKEQLAELRTIRQSAPETPKLAFGQIDNN